MDKEITQRYHHKASVYGLVVANKVYRAVAATQSYIIKKSKPIDTQKAINFRLYFWEVFSRASAIA